MYISIHSEEQDTPYLTLKFTLEDEYSDFKAKFAKTNATKEDDRAAQTPDTKMDTSADPRPCLYSRSLYVGVLVVHNLLQYHILVILCFLEYIYTSLCTLFSFFEFVLFFCI